MGQILTNLGMHLLIGTGGPVKLLRQLILKGSNDRTVELDPVVWEDLRFPSQSVKGHVGKEPTWTSYKGSQVPAFSDQGLLGNEEYVVFTAQIPHAYKEGEDIEVHVHWVGEDATAGNVRWRFTYSWANILGVFPGETTLYHNADNLTIADSHSYADFEYIDGSEKTISSMLLCSLSRNSSDVLDTFSGKDAYLLEIDFHIPTNTLGSRQEAIK